MKLHQFLHTISHSLAAKLLALIITLALIIVMTLWLFAQFVFASQANHTLFLLICIVVMLFVFAGFFLHRLLIPVHEISKGVQEISKGNLDYKLSIGGEDELGKLARAFNQMTNELQHMIESREQLLLDVSHELRTPITRALLALEMENDSEYVRTAKRNMSEVETMIKELLETHRLRSSMDQLQRNTISCHSLLKDVTAEYAKVKPGIVVNPVSENIKVSIDEKLMKIVLRNVIDNALKYSAEQKIPIEISVIDQGNQVIIKVEDFGPGLSPDEIEKVFEPFYRTDKSRSRKTGGYGLGLHLCKRIMEAHEGKIQINNKVVNKGLEVTLILPKD